MNWVSVAVGTWHTCGVKADETLWCWGGNTDGELGNGSTSDSLSPVQIGAATWASVALGVGAGGAHTCAVKQDGSLWCWGANSFGQLGTGSTTGSLTPRMVGSATWTSTAGGAAHTCGVGSDGTLWCWGDNESAQVGDGTQVNRLAPVQVPGQAWAEVAAGSGHTCGRRPDGSLWCWGDNAAGEIGDGGLIGQKVPEQVVGPLCSQVPLCGNGQVEQGEECDDGNTAPGDGCAMDCKVEKCFGVVCKASDECHAVGICDPDSGNCSNPAATDGTGCGEGKATARQACAWAESRAATPAASVPCSTVSRRTQRGRRPSPLTKPSTLMAMDMTTSL